jgi:hypothetical protein
VSAGPSDIPSPYADKDAETETIDVSSILSPASLSALLHEVKNLAVRYYALTGKPLGVTGEVAELEAAEKLGLTLSDVRTPYYDATRVAADRTERFQIKGRAINVRDRYRGRTSSIKCDGDFEWVLLVLLDVSTFDAIEIWQASRDDVSARLDRPGSRARNERLSLGIAQFKAIARLVWPTERVVEHNAVFGLDEVKNQIERLNPGD